MDERTRKNGRLVEGSAFATGLLLKVAHFLNLYLICLANNDTFYYLCKAAVSLFTASSLLFEIE